MYCDSNVSISYDRKNGLQEVLDSDPVIMLIISFSSQKTILISVEMLQSMRAVWTVSIHSEYLKNWLCGLDVTWQPVRGDLTVHLTKVILLWAWSVGSETPLTELVYCVNVALTMTERADKLHHDNVPAHSITALVQVFFWQSITSPRSVSPPYSPDLAPCDSWLFPKLKSPLKGGDL